MDDKISTMLDRAFILLEAEDWKKAEQIFDKILDAEPHSSPAVAVRPIIAVSVD